MNHHLKIAIALLLLVAVGVAAAACGPDAIQPTEAPTDTAAPVEPTPTPAVTDTPRPTAVNVAVALSPPTGPPGTEVQVTASGLPPDVEVGLGIGPRDTEIESVVTLETGDSGFLSTTLAVPGSAEPGEAWVVVARTEDGAVEAVSNPFDVTVPEYRPQVALSPSTGPPGAVVEVVAEGFPPDASVEVGLGREDSEYDVVDTASTGADGTLTAQVTIPEAADPQERWVVVVTTVDRALEAVSKPFQVVGVGYQGTVAISPTSGPPGTAVQVVARGFPPEVEVDIGVGRVDSEYDVVSTTTSDEDGRVSTEITIPAFVEPEDRWVIVVASDQPPVTAVSDEFDVTQEPTPAGNLFTRTNIFLIAVGDDGQSGKEIGCDDSVVPVEIEIEPTIAPLTAALNRLLALGTREYGMSGLYNSLFRSDLVLDSVTITDGEAIIRLSGTLTIAGVCDAPRVRAQLEETALQYDTVDRVSIFVDGTPLDEMLAQN